MTNQDILTRFFQAENARDWETYRQFLHPEVKWYLSQFGCELDIIEGQEPYLARIVKAYDQSLTQFSCLDMQISQDGNRIVAHLISDQGKPSVDIFDFKGGLIIREYEFLMD